MKKTFLCLTILLVIGLSACGGRDDTQTPGTTSPSPSPAVSPTPAATPGGTAAASGEAIYKKSCISCHGDQLQGAMGPNLQKIGSKMNKDQIVTIVSNGKGAMPAFKGKLSDNEIGALADWLLTHK